MFKACQTNCNEDSKRHKSSLGTSINQGQLSKHKAIYVYALTFNSVVFATMGTCSLILFSNLFIYLLKEKQVNSFRLLTTYIMDHQGKFQESILSPTTTYTICTEKGYL